jgi:hypothetical protein
VIACVRDSTIVYFITPGVLPFLTNQDDIVQILFFAANAANMLGRVGTGSYVHVYACVCVVCDL